MSLPVRRPVFVPLRNSSVAVVGGPTRLLVWLGAEHINDGDRSRLLR